MPPLGPLVKEMERRLNKASGEQLPSAYLEKAKKWYGTDETAKFLSVFDGPNGKLNKAAVAFGLHGLPPVDYRNEEAPLDM